jgi:hypothetical protein
VTVTSEIAGSTSVCPMLGDVATIAGGALPESAPASAARAFLAVNSIEPANNAAAVAQPRLLQNLMNILVLCFEVSVA